MLLIDRSENRQTTSDCRFGDRTVADHQCRRRRRWRRPMPAGALQKDTSLACPFDEPHLIARGRQPNIHVEARGHAGRNRIRQRRGDRSQGSVAPATVDRPNPTEMPCKSARFDEPRHGLLLEHGVAHVIQQLLPDYPVDEPIRHGKPTES